MTKNFQIKIISTTGEVKDFVKKENEANNLYDMFVSNRNSFPEFKIEKVLKIEIISSRIIQEFDSNLIQKKEGKC
jgi:hypothetical protein